MSLSEQTVDIALPARTLTPIRPIFAQQSLFRNKESCKNMVTGVCTLIPGYSKTTRRQSIQ